MKPTLLALGLLVLTSAACSATPTLLFSVADLPALRSRITQPEHAKTWQALLADAEHLLRVDPTTVDAVKGKPKIQVLAHQYGRKLTQWMEALGFAYQITGDERFGRKGAELLTAMAQRLPVDDPRVSKSFAGARGGLMRGFAIGLDWCGRAMTEEQRALVEKTGADYIRFLHREADNPKCWWVPHHNFMGVAMGGAGALSLKLRSRFPDEAPGWTQACATRIEQWFVEGFDADGAYYEGALYGHYGLSNAILFAHALKRSGGADLFQHPHLRQIPHFYAMSMLPGEAVFDARNDSNYAGFSDPFMLRLAGEWNDALARWVWDRVGRASSPLAIVWANDVRPTPPQMPLGKLFKGRGLCVFRTGWAESDVMFSVESGEYRRVTHNQGDKGCFTLYGLGSRWAIDSGYGNKREPQGRDQTVAHNGVLIDGKGQGLSGCGLGTSGQILAYEWTDACGYVLCDMAEAYRQNSKGSKSVPVSRALRHCFFIRPRDGLPAYAVTLDDFAVDDQPHVYDWLLHTSASNCIEPNERGARLLPFNISGIGYITTPADTPGTGACDFAFDLPAAGTYSVWGRVRAAGQVPTKSDSFFVKMDGGGRIAWHMRAGKAWIWSRVAEGVQAERVAFELAAGRHVLRLETREPQAQIDALAIVPGDQLALEDPRTIRMEAEDGKVSAPMVLVPAPTPTHRPRLELVLGASAAAKVTQGHYDGHPRLKVRVQAVSPDFAAVLLPLPAGIATPEIAFTEADGCRAASIRWAQRHDRIAWRLRTPDRPTLSQTRW